MNRQIVYSFHLLPMVRVKGENNLFIPFCIFCASDIAEYDYGLLWGCCSLLLLSPLYKCLPRACLMVIWPLSQTPAQFLFVYGTKSGGKLVCFTVWVILWPRDNYSCLSNMTLPTTCMRRLDYQVVEWNLLSDKLLLSFSRPWAYVRRRVVTAWKH